MEKFPSAGIPKIHLARMWHLCYNHAVISRTCKKKGTAGIIMPYFQPYTYMELRIL